MVQKVFVTQDNKAKVICPECGKVRQMDVSKFSNYEKEVRLKCTCVCKHSFGILLERRKHIRRAVNLAGTLTVDSTELPVTITDISRRGLKVMLDEPVDLSVNDKVILNFVLDDAGNSHVRKEVIVRKVMDTQIGVEFLSQDHYDKLGPYLLFHFE